MIKSQIIGERQPVYVPVGRISVVFTQRQRYEKNPIGITYRTAYLAPNEKRVNFVLIAVPLTSVSCQDVAWGMPEFYAAII